jgi:hypothetical protein
VTVRLDWDCEEGLTGRAWVGLELRGEPSHSQFDSKMAVQDTSAPSDIHGDEYFDCDIQVTSSCLLEDGHPRFERNYCTHVEGRCGVVETMFTRM